MAHTFYYPTINLTRDVVLLVPLPGEDARPGDVDRGVVGTVRRAVIAGKGAHLGLQEMNNVKDKIETCSNSERIL